MFQADHSKHHTKYVNKWMDVYWYTPNIPKITTKVCTKLPKMGIHINPKKSKTCLSRVLINCNAKMAYSKFLPLHEGICKKTNVNKFRSKQIVLAHFSCVITFQHYIIFSQENSRKLNIIFFFLVKSLCFLGRWSSHRPPYKRVRWRGRAARANKGQKNGQNRQKWAVVGWSSYLFRYGFVWEETLSNIIHHLHRETTSPLCTGSFEEDVGAGSINSRITSLGVCRNLLNRFCARKWWYWRFRLILVFFWVDGNWWHFCKNINK